MAEICACEDLKPMGLKLKNSVHKTFGYHLELLFTLTPLCFHSSWRVPIRWKERKSAETMGKIQPLSPWTFCLKVDFLALELRVSHCFPLWEERRLSVVKLTLIEFCIEDKLLHWYHRVHRMHRVGMNLRFQLHEILIIQFQIQIISWKNIPYWSFNFSMLLCYLWSSCIYLKLNASLACKKKRKWVGDSICGSWWSWILDHSRNRNF